MITFIARLIFGGISGGVTFAASGDPRVSLIAGGIAAALTWIGWAPFLVLDGDL